MRLSAIHAVPGRLLSLTLLLACLPLAALGWLGWQVLQQDRALESEHQRERLDIAANLLADTFAKTSAAQLPPHTVWVLFNSRGVIRHQGVSLPYYPSVAPPHEASKEVFTAAEAAEFRQTDPSQAIAQYRPLASSKDPSIRAEGLMRLARVLRAHGQIREALAVYGDLANMGSTSVAGDPAELVARRQRAVLLDASGDTHEATAEREALATILAEGHYTLDRATYDLYRENLPPRPTAALELATDIEKWWPRWHAEPSGRSTWTENNTAFASVWSASAEGTVATLGYIEVGPVAAYESAYRRNLVIVGFGLMTAIILGAAFFVFRAFQREWRVARLRSDFVAQVSHEFRSPLTAMCHLTELLEEGGTPTQRLPEYYRALGRETRRLHAMVENLLDFGRMEAGRRIYQMKETRIEDVARRVVDEFASPRLRLDLSAPAPPVRADRDALALAVRNLVDNAMKYSPESSEVTVSVEAVGEKAGIAVLDQGAGISPEEQRKIIGSFVRGRAAQTMNVKGTGIGLAMVDQVARAHGGRLEIDSQLGHGARFTLWFPAAEPPS